MVRVAAVGAALAALTLATACGNESVRSDRAPSASSSESSRVPSELADSPKAAALDMDASLRENRPSRYDCWSGGDKTFVVMQVDNPATTTATTSRVGDRWVVEVTILDHAPINGGSTMRYEVTKRDGGYCVSDIV